jgi:energy-coupling factor transport system substrate-specific component
MSRFTTKDIVTIVVISVVFGIVGAGWGYIWNLAFAVPTIGGIFSAALTFVWFIAPLVSFYLIRKPGVALVTQLLTGVIAILAGHPSGVVVYGWYILEGIGAELGFAIFRYKRVDMPAMMLAGFLQAINYGWGLVYFQIYQFGFAAWFWPWVFTFATAWVAGPIGLGIGRALARTGLYGMTEEAALE